MTDLADLYRPITASPFRNDDLYAEIPPCDALKPFIRCFWGTNGKVKLTGPELVIPDTCMDIVFTFDYTNNTTKSCFCTIDEAGTLCGRSDGTLFTSFGIRFYAWSAALFTDISFSGRKNRFFDADEFAKGIGGEMLPMLAAVDTLEERARFAEKNLCKRLDTGRMNSIIMNSVYDIIGSGGNAAASELARNNAVSVRQLERIFDENIGISPKKLASLFRYQMLWQELSRGKTDILGLAEKYGYYDQAHLLHDFGKRHLMTPRAAVEFAKKDVAFLQYGDLNM